MKSEFIQEGENIHDEELIHVEWIKNKSSYQFLKFYLDLKIKTIEEGNAINTIGVLHTINNLLDEFLTTNKQLDERIKANPGFYERLNEPLTPNEKII